MMPTHRANILDYLARLEVEEDIEVLFACESGSRAWGIESSDSDYDVRFIYKRPVRDYLVLGERKDTIHRMYEDNLYDFAGWDLDKALSLSYKSNPSILEWMASDIIYVDKEKFSTPLSKILQGFSPMALMHHYANLAHNQWKQYCREGEDLTLKKYLYAVRPLVAVYWMVDNGYRMPPIDFLSLNPQLFMRDEEYVELGDLLAKKKVGTELETKGRYKALDAFILDGIEVTKGYASYAPRKVPDFDKLTKLYHSELFS